VAELYDRVRAPLHEGPARDLVALLQLGPDDRVLDVGTGTGVAARAAQEATAPGGLVIGVDTSLQMLRMAGERGVRLRAQAQALDLPFADGAFTAVTAAFVIFFFKKYETALHDLKRVLHPGGRLGVTTWGPIEDEFRRAWRAIAEAFVGREMLSDAMRQAAPWERHFSDPAKLKEALRDSGFREVRVEERPYRHTIGLDDYIAGRETSATGRFLRGMLGETVWERFHARVTEAFHERFPDPIGDTDDVLLAIGVNPG
jgi:ubiquinone/menaquinone biosynthesis C-methylase UbiE